MKYYRGKTIEADRMALARMEAAFSIKVENAPENAGQKPAENKTGVENVLENGFSTPEIETT